MRHNPFSGNGTNALNQTATQIFLNPCQRGRFGFAVFNDLKLLPILEMLFPSPLKLKGLSSLNIGKVTNDRG
jgi:hypothetical protein